MSENEKESPVVEFKDATNATKIPADSDNTNSITNFDSASAELEEVIGTKDLKPFEWMGVEFPPYFQGPHFVEVKGSIVMAIDPACVSLEMKANWDLKYRKELADLGKKVIEKYLNIKIETL